MQEQEYVRDAVGVDHLMGVESNIWTFYTVDDAEDLWAALRAKLPPKGGSGALAMLQFDYSAYLYEEQMCAYSCDLFIYVWSDTEIANEDECMNFPVVVKPDSIAEDAPGRWKWLYDYWWPFNRV